MVCKANVCPPSQQLVGPDKVFPLHNYLYQPPASPHFHLPLIEDMSRNPFPFDERIPLVPDILVRGPQAGELIEPVDPMQWTESCVVRALGSSIAGGVMGFAFGALFSGYGSLQPLDHGEFPPRMAVTRPPIGITGGRPATLAPPSLLPPYIPLPGALPYSHYEPPSQPLMAAFKDGIKDVRGIFYFLLSCRDDTNNVYLLPTNLCPPSPPLIFSYG